MDTITKNDGPYRVPIDQIEVPRGQHARPEMERIRLIIEDRLRSADDRVAGPMADTLADCYAEAAAMTIERARRELGGPRVWLTNEALRLAAEAELYSYAAAGRTRGS